MLVVFMEFQNVKKFKFKNVEAWEKMIQEATNLTRLIIVINFIEFW